MNGIHEVISAFFMLSLILCLSFRHAVNTTDLDRAELFVDLSRDLSLAIAGVVSGYFATQSVWPSRTGYSMDRPRRLRRQREEQEPAVGPDAGDEMG